MPLWVTLAATGAEVSRVLSTARVVEEEPLEVSLTVRRGPFGLPGAEIIEPLAPARIAVARAVEASVGLAARGDPDRHDAVPPWPAYVPRADPGRLRRAGAVPRDPCGA